jgi:hypothetical protein
MRKLHDESGNILCEYIVGKANVVIFPLNGKKIVLTKEELATAVGKPYEGWRWCCEFHCSIVNYKTGETWDNTSRPNESVILDGEITPAMVKEYYMLLGE